MDTTGNLPSFPPREPQVTAAIPPPNPHRATPPPEQMEDPPPLSTGTRQYLWLVRYGLTHPGLMENVGPYDSDLQDPVGLEHARATGERLANPSQPAAVPTMVYSDPFLRCMRTADLVCKAINAAGDGGGEVRVRVEEGTTEWQVPSLLVGPDGTRTHPRTAEELAVMFPATVDATYRSVNPQGPDRTDEMFGGGGEGDADRSPRFPESEDELHSRITCTLERILEDVGDERSLAIVGHAPCVQHLALCLEGSATPAEARGLGPWSCGGVTLFSRPAGKVGSWSLEMYSDTEHMPEEYREGKKGAWSLPSFAR